MTMRYLRFWIGAACLAIIAVPQAHAQYAKAPDTYSVTEANNMFAQGEILHIYRDGSKALIDISVPPQSGGLQGTRTATLYDLQAGTTYSWDPSSASNPCGQGNFSGDWGDPFAGSADMMADLAKQNAKQVGTGSLNGFDVKIYDANNPMGGGGTLRAWVDAKYGLLVRLQAGQQTLIEVTQFSGAKPPASVFAVPAACSQVPPPTPVVTDSQKFATETGRNGDDYVDAFMPPATPSTTSCTMLFKVVHSGTMEPITSGITIKTDLNQGPNAGNVSGGPGMTEDLTSQYRNGVLRVDNIPVQFNLSVVFGNGGEAAALIHRQCFAPQTVLFLVVKNPDQITDGAYWLWSKTGK